MCLSPQVDIAVGAVIVVAGINSLRNCPDKKYLPLAVTPLLFAAHSFSSALVWCGFSTSQPAWVTSVATNFYVIFAYVFLPIFIPLTILAIDWTTNRRRWLLLLLALGGIAGLDFANVIASGAGRTTQCSYYVDYNIYGSGWWTGVLYVVATCGAMLISKQRMLQLWGFINLIAVGALGLAQNQGLPSLWCFLAAATSFFISFYMRKEKRGVQELNLTHPESVI